MDDSIALVLYSVISLLSGIFRMQNSIETSMGCWPSLCFLPYIAYPYLLNQVALSNPLWLHEVAGC